MGDGLPQIFEEHKHIFVVSTVVVKSRGLRLLVQRSQLSFYFFGLAGRNSEMGLREGDYGIPYQVAPAPLLCHVTGRRRKRCLQCGDA